MSPIIEVTNLERSFGGVPVLTDVSFSIEPGEVVALAGENGAGKSTIFKIITGQIRPDKGTIRVDGEIVERLDTQKSRELGIGIVPQELAPYPELTVYENLFVGRERKTALGTLDRSGMISEASEMLEVFGVAIDPRIKMGELSTALTQIVEIVKATTWGAKVILLDEPTSSIPEQEVKRLYDIVHALRDRGVAMMYTTHRMAEIQEIATRVLVMRDGVLVADSPVAEIEPDAIISAMIGRDLENLFPKLPSIQQEVGIEIRNLVLDEESTPISFTVHKGEIVGLGGLVGAGRTEILQAIYGVDPVDSGSVIVEGRELKLGSPRRAIDSGIAIVPEDRKGAGLILLRSVLDNGSLPRLKDFLTGGFIRMSRRKKAVGDSMKKVSLKARSLDQSVGTLSGGNQQKIVIARWLSDDTKVLLLDEPTRGVDVGARGEIYTIIRDLAASGMSVILASSDTPELIGLSHRVLVVRDGQVTGELSRAELDSDDAQEKIFRLASDQTLLNA